MDEKKERPVSISKLSKTPSWISLGFILGVLFVWMLPKPDPVVIQAPAQPQPPLVVKRLTPDLTRIEAVFEVWGDYAVWEHDLTEVALWNTQTKRFDQFYEVLRSGGAYYYRSITGFTRPVLTHGVEANAPLLFTETEADRREWLRQSNAEVLSQIKASLPGEPPVEPTTP